MSEERPRSPVVRTVVLAVVALVSVGAAFLLLGAFVADLINLDSASAMSAIAPGAFAFVVTLVVRRIPKRGEGDEQQRRNRQPAEQRNEGTKEKGKRAQADAASRARRVST